MPAPSRSWVEDAREIPPLDVAMALGLDRMRRNSFGPCPSCGARYRNNPGRAKDSRGRCRITPDGGGWICDGNGDFTGCGAKGDGLNLVALHLTGNARFDKNNAAKIRAFYAENGWCEPDTVPGRDGKPRMPPRPRLQPEPDDPRPPFAEVAALWGRCIPVTDPRAADVAAWLLGHHDGPIDPVEVARLDLARALPTDLTQLPRWAWCNGESWAAGGYRLVVRMAEADSRRPGSLRIVSLHARNVQGREPKGAAPLGCDASGLVMATGADPAAHGLPLIELLEGEPDWLRVAVEVARLPEGRRSAVWGVVSGSSCAEIAALVPVGIAVAIRTDDDRTGDKYAEDWAKLLLPRGCKLKRRRKVNAPTTCAAPSTPSAERIEPNNSKDLAEWTRIAMCDLPQSAGDGEALACVWCLCGSRCGGSARVPKQINALLSRMISELPQGELAIYHAKLGEFGGCDVG